MVLTTFTVLADVAENVAGDKLRVESITKAGAEIHGYEPTPGDIRKAAQADLILDNGLNLEAWFAQFVEGLDVPHAVVSDGVEVIAIAEDAYQGKPNPHAWMSPAERADLRRQHGRSFQRARSRRMRPSFEANGDAYKAELQTVQDELVVQLAVLPENARALVTCEGAFSYLARDAGLTEVYIWAGQRRTAGHAPADRRGPSSSSRTTRCRPCSANPRSPTPRCSRSSEPPAPTFGGTLYVDSLSEADGPVPTYLDLIRHDAEDHHHGTAQGSDHDHPRPSTSRTSPSTTAMSWRWTRSPLPWTPPGSAAWSA